MVSEWLSRLKDIIKSHVGYTYVLTDKFRHGNRALEDKYSATDIYDRAVCEHVAKRRTQPLSDFIEYSPRSRDVTLDRNLTPLP